MNTWGDTLMLARTISSEKIAGQKREAVVLAYPMTIFNTIRNAVNAFVDNVNQQLDIFVLAQGPAQCLLSPAEC